jgi:ABC-type phosphate transport system substrate-binding protein
VKTETTHLVRLAFAATVAAGVLTAVSARAQQSCGALANPIVVTGSTSFEPTLRELAVKLAAEPAPATIVINANGVHATSCAGIANVVGGTDFGSGVGRYYTRNGTTVTSNTCVFAAGQTAHVAISDVFYETCAGMSQPRPADIADVPGPVHATVFVVPKANTAVQYLTDKEAQTLFGCGASTTRPVAGFFSNPMGVFCRDPAVGTQIVVARTLGLSESALVQPKCIWSANDGTLLKRLIPIGPPEPGQPAVYEPPPAAIGFSSAAELDRSRAAVNPLAFQAAGQTLAFYPDSSATVADRRNVRDGHYAIWGYVHLIAKTNGGNLGTQAADLIGWVSGTKTSPKIDHVALEAGAGLIPQCAMQVQRSSDGGLLSPYTPAKTCHCGFEAAITRALPAGCTACASDGVCPCGSSCRHGFCG